MDEFKTTSNKPLIYTLIGSIIIASLITIAPAYAQNDMKAELTISEAKLKIIEAQKAIAQANKEIAEAEKIIAQAEKKPNQSPNQTHLEINRKTAQIKNSSIDSDHLISAHQTNSSNMQQIETTTTENQIKDNQEPPKTYTYISPIDFRYNQIIDKKIPDYYITPYQPNYIIYTKTDNVNYAAYDAYSSAQDWNLLQDQELKYQISFYIPIAFDIFGKNSSLNFSYTQRSYFQILNSDLSAPFRETNYEPQLFASWATNYDIAGFKLKLIDFGYHHQSNGQSNPLSRSWNRIFIEGSFVRDEWSIQARLWKRIDQYLPNVGGSELAGTHKSVDDNPNIEHYMGDGYINVGYRYKQHTFSAKTQASFSHGRIGIELGYSYLINNNVQLYAQLFSGYGEDLIDYNIKQTRYGFGVLISNYF